MKLFPFFYAEFYSKVGETKWGLILRAATLNLAEISRWVQFFRVRYKKVKTISNGSIKYVPT